MTPLSEQARRAAIALETKNWINGVAELLNKLADALQFPAPPAEGKYSRAVVEFRKIPLTVDYSWEVVGETPEGIFVYGPVSQRVFAAGVAVSDLFSDEMLLELDKVVKEKVEEDML